MHGAGLEPAWAPPGRLKVGCVYQFRHPCSRLGIGLDPKCRSGRTTGTCWTRPGEMQRAPTRRVWNPLVGGYGWAGLAPAIRMILDVTLPTAHLQCAVGVLQPQDNTVLGRWHQCAESSDHGS